MSTPYKTLYEAIADVKIKDCKLGDTFVGNNINDFFIHTYADVSKINCTLSGLNFCVPYQVNTGGYESHYFPIYRTDSKEQINRDLQSKILKEAKVKYVGSIYEINKYLSEFLINNTNPMFYKYRDNLLLIDVNAFKVYIETNPLAYSYAIAYHKPLVYMFEDAKRILSSLEKEIEDIQTMGYKE